MSKSQTPEERRLIEILTKIEKLVDEAHLSVSAPALVATPLPVAVSVEQAAALLGVAPSTLDDPLRSGRLRSFHMGRRRLITLDALYDFAKAMETEC